MPDILDAAQTNNQPAGGTPPPADPLPPPPPPPEPAPEPVMPPAPTVTTSDMPSASSTDASPALSTDSLIVPPPEPEVPPSEAPAPTIEPPPVAPPPPPPQPQEPKKKKRVSPALIIAGFLMLFITIPLIIFGVQQQQEIRSKAMEVTGGGGEPGTGGGSSGGTTPWCNPARCPGGCTKNTTAGGDCKPKPQTTTKECPSKNSSAYTTILKQCSPICNNDTGQWECPGGAGCPKGALYQLGLDSCNGKKGIYTCNVSTGKWECKTNITTTCETTGCPGSQTCFKTILNTWRCSDDSCTANEPACSSGCKAICDNSSGLAKWSCPTSCTSQSTCSTQKESECRNKGLICVPDTNGGRCGNNPDCVADDICMRDNPSIPCCNGSHSVPTSECGSGKKCGGNNTNTTFCTSSNVGASCTTSSGTRGTCKLQSAGKYVCTAGTVPGNCEGLTKKTCPPNTVNVCYLGAWYCSATAATNPSQPPICTTGLGCPPGCTCTGPGHNPGSTFAYKECECGGGGSVPTPTPGGGGGGGGGGQCIPINVYNAAGTLLTKAQLTKLKAGTTITFGVKPPVPQVTKARFKVNNDPWKETTRKKNGEYIYNYKIPKNVDSFTVTAQGFFNNRWY